MKRIIYLMVVCIGVLLPTFSTNAQEISLSDNTAVLLKKQLKINEAAVWFLYNDAFAIKTRNHLLIFDYFPMGEVPAAPSLANGFINPEEFRDLDVVVFVTHRDGDHYNKIIWEWRKVVKNITYVFGFDPAIAQETYFHPQPWKIQRIGDIEVTGVPALDSGEGFLVKVDGLNIYHGGDNAMFWEYYRETHVKSIDFLAEKVDYVDLLFINWRTGVDRAYLEEGLWYAADRFSARAIIPMHIMADNLSQIKELVKDAPTAEKATKIVAYEKRGDVFIYRNGKIIIQ